MNIQKLIGFIIFSTFVIFTTAPAFGADKIKEPTREFIKQAEKQIKEDPVLKVSYDKLTSPTKRMLLAVLFKNNISAEGDISPIPPKHLQVTLGWALTQDQISKMRATNKTYSALKEGSKHYQENVRDQVQAALVSLFKIRQDLKPLGEDVQRVSDLMIKDLQTDFDRHASGEPEKEIMPDPVKSYGQLLMGAGDSK